MFFFLLFVTYTHITGIEYALIKKDANRLFIPISIMVHSQNAATNSIQ